MASWVIGVIQSTGLLGIVLLMFVENVFPPIPSEVIMPLAGYLATQGKMSFVAIVLAGTAGSVLGALPLYYLGHSVGRKRLKRLADRHGRWLTVSRDDLEKAEDWFNRHGWAAVFFCRLVPGVRSLISIPAGIQKMNMLSFLAFTAVGSALWTTLLAALGYWLGSNYKTVDKYLDPVSWVIFGGILAMYIYRVVTHKSEEEGEDEGASDAE